MGLDWKRTMFIHTNQLALIRTFLRNGRVRGKTDRAREG